MRRVIPLLIAMSLGFAPVPVYRERQADQRRLAGRWSVEFANGVVETCELRADGGASVAEPARASGGKSRVVGAALVITFEDGRVERWKVGSAGVAVEHWSPASRYPSGPSVRGTARRLR